MESFDDPPARHAIGATEGTPGPASFRSRTQRQTQSHLRATLDSLTDGFLTLDRQWRITYANPAAEAILGMAMDTLVGQMMWDAFPGAEHGQFGQHYREAMAHARVVRFEAEYPPLSMWFRVSAFPSPDGIAISFTDITAARETRERQRVDNADLERRVRERTGDLRRMNEELAYFTSAVTNDLRAPLAHVDGFSRALSERLPPGADAQLHHYAARVRAGVARMEGLLDALLQLSHIGRSELSPRNVDLSAIARETVDALWSRQPGPPAQVEVQEGLRAWGDARLLRTMLEHLVATAWKSSACRQPARIAIGQRPYGAFYVQDNGPGLAEARVAELFAPSRRLDGTQDADGIGIAVAIARRVVERHGGRIWAETVPGAGTTFCFRLP
jgi:PAS domain S-box-containing protein